MKATTTRRLTISMIAASSLIFGACGGGSSSADTTAAATCDAENIASPRIVSLSPTATEMLVAIGAGDNLAAVDSLSTWPESVSCKVTKISAYEPSAEAIVAYEPEVVVISNDMNKITEQLKAADPGITVWTGAAAASLDDVYGQIADLGELTGHENEAADLVESMKGRIAEATKAVDGEAGSLSYYYELDNTFYSVTSNTFVGALLKPFGMVNIADGVETGNDWPQLSAEAIVKADPSIIFLADTKCCQQDATTVAARAGWSGISAVKNGNVVELDDDIASRWGPRVVDLVETFAAAVKKARG